MDKNEIAVKLTGLNIEDLIDTLQSISDTYLLFYMQDNQFKDEETSVYCNAVQLRDIIQQLKK